MSLKQQLSTKRPYRRFQFSYRFIKIKHLRKATLRAEHRDWNWELYTYLLPGLP